MTDLVRPHPAGHLATISAQFARPWQIVRPRVFRYLPSRYVDAFFRDGSLRLSSFAQFGKHLDEQRRDEAEGRGVRIGAGEQLTVAYASSQGQDTYVLCTSLIYGERLQDTFEGSDGCFAIDNTIEFAGAVAQALAMFVTGLEGPCIYQEDPTIMRDLGDETFDQLVARHRQEDGTLNMDLLSEAHAKVAGTEPFFVKSMKYSDQAEYRMLWQVDGVASDFLDIKVPAARQYCRKIK